MVKGWLGIIATGLMVFGDPPAWLEQGGMVEQIPVAIAADLEQRTMARGQQMRVNGKTLRGNWLVWTENGTTRLAVESMNLEKSLGLQLLDTYNAEEQPVSWFGQGDRLPTKFENPYRYLDITAFATAAQWQWQQQGDMLELRTPAAQIREIRPGRQAWGQRIVIDLDRPALWRKVSPTKISIQATLAPNLQPQLKQNKQTKQRNPFELPPFEPFKPQQQPPRPATANLPFTLSTENGETVLTFDQAIAPEIQVSSLGNPMRLIIDLRRDAQPERTIQWLPGLVWQQRNIQLPGRNNSGFAVTWLEIDPTRQNFQLKPISPSDQTIVGLAPMLTQVQVNGAIAGINAGFFNRNNQYPLGAIREDDLWRSSPILNRGAIAWDNEGFWDFDRLTIREELVANNGERVSIDFFNSGYVKAGVSRYTQGWGNFYVPMVDNEVILTIQSNPKFSGVNTVIQRDNAPKAGQGSYPIPANGYLLVFRSFRSGADKFPVGTTFDVISTSFPESFQDAPQVMGAGPLLVKNGQVVLNGAAEQFSTAFNLQSASRSAIARTRDGKIILATVHGSAAETSGATLRQWADLMVRLGAVDALNLDGGGSSALVLGGDLGDRHSSSVGRVNNGIGLFLDDN